MRLILNPCLKCRARVKDYNKLWLSNNSCILIPTECPVLPPVNTELEEADGEGHIKEERERVKEEERQTDRLKASFPLTCSFRPQHRHPHIPNLFLYLVLRSQSNQRHTRRRVLSVKYLTRSKKSSYDRGISCMSVYVCACLCMHVATRWNITSLPCNPTGSSGCPRPSPLAGH